ncbi:MAG: hypothetical protein CL946_13260 [Ectothiorhodospiraceae bacterium]|nr:hypothetical protein [Ectothiorhodospiraceae bacterium]
MTNLKLISIGWVAVLLIGFAAGLTAQEAETYVTSEELQASLDRQTAQIESLRAYIAQQMQSIEYLDAADSLNRTSLQSSADHTNAKFQLSSAEFGERIVPWFVAVLVLLAVALTYVLIVTRRAKAQVSELELRLNSFRNAVQSDAISRESSLLEMQKKHWSTFAATPQANGAPATGDAAGSLPRDDHDHTLPIRVADEIHRMRKRIEYMPDEAKGIKALRNSLKRLEEELNMEGYEVVDLIGAKYVDGLNVEARFVPREDETTEDETITDVIRPQVNYNGVMVQQAKVEVSKSYE